MQDTESQMLARTLTSWLRKGVTGWEDFQHADPDAAWQVTNALAHALAGRELKFLSGSVGSSRKADIAAYTADFLVRVVRSPEHKYADSWVIPRGDLNLIEVVSAPAVLPPRTPGSRRSAGSYKLFYGKNPHWLPVPGAGTEGLEEFIPSLWDDLVK